MVVALTAHITTPKGNARTFVNLREKNVKFCRAGGPGRTLDAPGSNLFTGGFFFILLKERKRITVIFPMISFFQTLLADWPTAHQFFSRKFQGGDMGSRSNHPDFVRSKSRLATSPCKTCLHKCRLTKFTKLKSICFHVRLLAPSNFGE
jgi:hypothetical protein